MRKNIITVALVLALIGFITLGVTNIRHTNEKLQLKEIELKSNEAKLIELNLKYDQVIQLQTQTEKEKQEKLERIQKLEEERAELEKELQAKRETQNKLAEAAKKASGTNTAHAASNGRENSVKSSTTNNCTELRDKLSRLGVNGSELDAAITLATRESSCRSSAVNKSSGACGEFQSYPCGKWGSPGTDQYLINAINYARNRYGSYNGALAHSFAKGWY